MKAVAALRPRRHAGRGTLRPVRALVGAHEHADRVGRAAGTLQRRVQHLDAARAWRGRRRRDRHDGLAEPCRRRADGGRHRRRRPTQDLRPVLSAVIRSEYAAAVDARVQDAIRGGRRRVERERARIAECVDARRPVLAAVDRAKATARRCEIQDVAVRGIDDDDVDPLVHELQRVAGVVRRIARAEPNPASARVRRLEQACLRLRGNTSTRAEIHDRRIGGIDRERTWLAYRERQLAIEQRNPRRPTVVGAPRATAGRADVDNVRVRRMDRNGRHKAVDGRRTLRNGTGADGRPRGPIEAHRLLPLSPPLRSGGCGGSSAGGSLMSVGGRTTDPGSFFHCSSARW